MIGNTIPGNTLVVLMLVVIVNTLLKILANCNFGKKGQVNKKY